ncbi:peroxide stress protein YaaA [Corynebacterium breve]|uniref:Peroxide stress protein YaaA n=1 Tax=Corynebacterium breve TaxID=3049799 RepID=A0ABY8VHA5_9CORY|nr:peroxide stress protein YaaA [Corynebacterium breve]WIM69041.1 peroxide stress protein YaaA [Corynebacterium breve]
MLIVLPPSETKAAGGERDPMDVSFPALNPVRAELMDDLAALSATAQLPILKISEKMLPEAEANLTLRTAPVMPAIFRYTGVLYDALDADSLNDDALSRLAIGSALFGIVRAGDMIPKYRLSGGTKLPRRDGTIPTMKARWGSLVTQVLEDSGEFVVDMRSGTYQQLGKAPGAMTVRVESVQEDGTRKVVSHFNKHYKGQLARALASSISDAADIAGVAEIASAAGFSTEVEGTVLTLVV